jgi:hypothetical protein
VETDKNDGTVVVNETTTVAPDGKTAVLEFNNRTEADRSQINGKSEEHERRLK